jgi:hypothetical protein
LSRAFVLQLLQTHVVRPERPKRFRQLFADTAPFGNSRNRIPIRFSEMIY